MLESTTCEKDLVITITSNLKWSSHVNNVVSKANQALGMLKNTFSYFDEDIVRRLYTAFVRPNLEYAVAVWSPYLKKDIAAIERTQHRVTRLTSSLRKLDYDSRLKVLNLQTLEQRRQRGDLIQVFRILNDFDQVK